MVAVKSESFGLAAKLTAENTAIVLDSTTGLRAPGERHPNWHGIPLYLRLGEDVFRDGIDMQAAEFFRRLRESEEQPRSSQPSAGDFAVLYESLAGFERILSVHISSKLSGTCESARIAAAETEGRVTVFDSASVSAGIVLLAEAVQRRLEAGTTDAELADAVERHLEAARFVYTLDSLEYLVRGGRVGKAAGLASQVLATKPVIEIRGGENVPVKRVRGRAQALRELSRAFAESGAEDGTVGIVHADARADAERLASAVRESRPDVAVELFEFSPVIGTNTGPGAVALAWR